MGGSARIQDRLFIDGRFVDAVDGATFEVPVEPGFLNYVLREPLGVVGQIVPWT